MKFNDFVKTLEKAIYEDDTRATNYDVIQSEQEWEIEFESSLKNCYIEEIKEDEPMQNLEAIEIKISSEVIGQDNKHEDMFMIDATLSSVDNFSLQDLIHASSIK